MPKCKVCGADIRWEYTADGKEMPVDAKMTYVRPGNGDTTILDDRGRIVKGERVVYPAAHTVQGHVPHWGTCEGRRPVRVNKAAQVDGQIDMFGEA